ncbi:hypothetical protein [Heyndrickxia acidicola]|uniref:Uncharacterized protein n=1 Tax=Heyndrickxia acidicola TaxID=209389 RepID=A0ABU6MIH6_9BACI|nr:hypothetical protein [Heyndrickxia acidicola]MED1204475.1 hypothetical protein [Heyndrickxia acidicola]
MKRIEIHVKEAVPNGAMILSDLGDSNFFVLVDLHCKHFFSLQSTFELNPNWECT